MLTLHQFTCSHFCEKARWALDWKGVPYRINNLLVGLHVGKIKKLAPKSSVPVLIDHQQVVQGSGAIISYLDERYPHDPLTPTEPRTRQEALEWESFLDERLGVPLRLYLYHRILPDRELATQFLLSGMSWWVRPVYRAIFPQVRDAMTGVMRISPRSAERAKRMLDQALEELNSALDGKDFLVGDRFTRADLTASALLSSTRLSPQRLPPVLDSFYRESDGQRCFQWTADIYRQYRRNTADRPCP